MPAPRPSRRALLVRRGLALVAVTLAGLTCRDGGPTGPGLPQWGSAALLPTLRAARVGPAIRLDAVRAQLIPLPVSPGDGVPVVDTVGRFASGGSELRLTLAAPVTDPQQEFELRIAATDAAGDTSYRAIDTVRLSVGGTPEPREVALTYAGADTIVASLAIAPRDTQFVVGDSVAMRHVARRADQGVVTTARVGFAVSDSAAMSITPTGWLKASRAATGVWVYVGTANGRIDSTRVTSFIPVRRVDLSPPTAQLAVGDTLALTATTFDRNDAVLTGRTVTFASLDTTATVSATGLVVGRATGTARIVAASEGVADTSTITVVPQPVASIVVTPDTARIARGDSLDLTVVLRDRLNNVLTGRTVAWSSSDAAVATVSAAGRVRALASTGLARIVATAEGGRADTTVVLAQPRPAATVVLSPDSLVLLPAQRGVLTATALDAQGQPAPDLGITWTSLDPGIATVQAGAGIVGEVTAIAVGTARIVARVGTVADTVPVRVRAAVTELRISPRADTLLIPALGNDTLQLAAQAFDGGTPVANARVTWTSRTPAVALVDTTGMVRSVTEGLSWIVATEQQSRLADSVLVRVRQVVARVAVAPDTLAVAALGVQQRYAAVAYDRNDVAVPVPAFTWGVSASGVVALDSTTGPNAWYTAVGNGTASVTATVDGVTGAGRVTVQQQLAGIVVNPTALALSAGNTAVLAAIGVDGGGRPLSLQPALLWRSDDESVATVDNRGVVTARATGTARITAAAGPVTSNQVVVDVTSLAIQLEADTINVGSRTEVQMIVRLSGAPTENVTVGLFLADTGVVSLGTSFGLLSFSPGVTAQVVPLVGQRLGSVRLVAAQADGNGCDGACPPLANPAWRPDTATIVVVAGLQLEGRGQLALGDSAEAQLSVQTPAPAGGLRVVFDYDVPGVARVLPDTVFLPEGHLGAAVQVRTLSQGFVAITPRVVGAPEPPGIRTTLQVGPPMMELAHAAAYLEPITIGLGQADPYAVFALLRTPPSGPLPMAVAGRRARVQLPATIEVPAGQFGAYLPVAGLQLGVDTITVTAPAPFGTATAPVTVTTPHMALFGENGEDTLPAVLRADREEYEYEVTLAVTDSAGRRHPRGSRLAVRLVSSDPSVLRPIQEYWVIEAGDDATSLRVQLVGSGTATLTLSAEGHVPAARTLQVQLPKLTLSYGNRGDTATIVRLPRNRYIEFGFGWETEFQTRTATSVTVRHTNPAAIGPDTVFAYPDGDGGGDNIPVRTLAPGRDTMVITRPGYEPDTLVVDVLDRDQVTLSSNPGDTAQVGQPVFIAAQLVEAGRALTARSVRLRSLTPGIAALDTTVTIAPNFESAQGFTVFPLAPGTLQVELSTGGVVDTTWQLLVRPGKLIATTVTLPLDSISIGVGQLAQRPGAFGAQDHIGVFVQNSNADIAVTVAYDTPGVVSGPTSLLMQQNGSSDFSRSARLAVTGVAEGSTRVVFSASGYEPDTVVVRVARPALVEEGCIRFCGQAALPRTAQAGSTFNWEQVLAIADSLKAAQAALLPADAYVSVLRSTVTAPVTFRITSSDPSVVASDSATVTVTLANPELLPRIPLRFLAPGTATLTIEDVEGRYLPFARTVTVTAQVLQWRTVSNRTFVPTNGRTTLGTRQGFIVRRNQAGTITRDDRPQLCTNGPVAAPFSVAITSTDTLVGRAGAATDTVTFAATTASFGTCLPVDVESGARQGTVGIVARAVNGPTWTSDTLRLVVGRPTFVSDRPWWDMSRDTVFTGDTLGRVVRMLPADQAGELRRTLDPLDLQVGVTGPGVLALREPSGGTTTLGTTDADSVIIVRVGGLAPGRERVTIADARTGAPDSLRYAAGRSEELEVAVPYLRLTNADNLLAPTARQVNVSYNVGLPAGYAFPDGDTLWVQVRGAAALALPDSVPVTSQFGVPDLFTINGLAPGDTASVVLSAPGFVPDTARLTFVRGTFTLNAVDTFFPQGDSTLANLIVINAEGFDNQLTTQAQQVTLELPPGLAASDGTSRITRVTIPAGADRVSFWIVGTTVGSWRLRASHPDFAPFTSEVISVAERPNFVPAGGGP